MGFGIGNFFSRVFSSETPSITSEPVKVSETAPKEAPEFKDGFEAHSGTEETVPTKTNTVETRKSFSSMELLMEGMKETSPTEEAEVETATADGYDRDLVAFADYKGLFLKEALSELEYFKETNDKSDYDSFMKKTTSEYNTTASARFGRSKYSEEDVTVLSKHWNMSTEDTIGYSVHLMEIGKYDSLDETLKTAKASFEQ